MRCLLSHYNWKRVRNTDNYGNSWTKWYSIGKARLFKLSRSWNWPCPARCWSDWNHWVLLSVLLGERGNQCAQSDPSLRIDKIGPAAWTASEKQRLSKRKDQPNANYQNKVLWEDLSVSYGSLKRFLQISQIGCLEDFLLIGKIIIVRNDIFIMLHRWFAPLAILVAVHFILC